MIGKDFMYLCVTYSNNPEFLYIINIKWSDIKNTILYSSTIEINRGLKNGVLSNLYITIIN